MKKAVFSISEALGVNRLSASLHRHQPIIITFHGVTSDAPGHVCNQEDLHLHRPIFEMLMEHIARHYQPVPLSRIVDWLEGGAPAPERGVAVTFDDAYRNVLTDAAPILKRLGIPATLFVPTDFVFEKKMLWPDCISAAFALTRETQLAWEGRSFLLQNEEGKSKAAQHVTKALKPMTQEERLSRVQALIRSLRVENENLLSAWDGFRPLEPAELSLLPQFGITVGAHTCSHPIFSRLDADAQTRELVESKRLLEGATGVACDDFAYPNGGPGDFNAATRDCVVAAGYRSAVTTIKRRVAKGDDRFEIPRCTLTHNHISMAEFSAEVSGLPGALRRLKARASAPSGGNGTSRHAPAESIR